MASVMQIMFSDLLCVTLSHYLSKAIKLVKLVNLQVYKFNLSFVTIWGWVGGVWEILTLLGFKKTHGILDDPLGSFIISMGKKNVCIVGTQLGEPY